MLVVFRMMVSDFNGVFSKIENQGKNTKLFTIDLDREISFKPGQFVNLIFELNGEKFMKPYSIASSNKLKKQIELCVNLVGNGKTTPYLFRKKIGDKVKVKGPLGFFKLDDKSQKEKIVFIATGTGVSPLRSMILNLVESGTDKQLHLILGIRYEYEILFEKEFREIERNNPNFKFTPVISKPTEKWEGRVGYVQDNLDGVDVLNSGFYVCGLSQMVEEVKNKLLEKGASEEDIYFERYI